MIELKSSVPVKQETNVFHQNSLKNRAISCYNLNEKVIEVANKMEEKKNKDRHRPGYWKERWAKQKAAKAAAETGNNPKPKKKKKIRKDRHRPGYYHDYNQKHPERLNRGFTKGYINGNVSDGPIVKEKPEIAPGIYLLGYDELGRPITNNPFGDLLRNKEMEWHDDDWFEGINDD